MRPADEVLRTWTYQQYWDDALTAGRAFMKLGLKPHQSVNIIGFNSPEWILADMGCIAAGGIAAGMYTTNQPEACQYVASHSDAAVVVCQGKNQLDKLVAVQGELPAMTALVTYDYTPTDEDKAACKVSFF